MENLIKIILIVVFAFFMAKKYIIPRIAAKRAARSAAKSGIVPQAFISEDPIPHGSCDTRTAQAQRRGVSCFDMRIVSYDTPGDSEEQEPFITRLKCAANEMLLNASTRGTDVHLGIIKVTDTAYMLYIIYTV